MEKILDKIDAEISSLEKLYEASFSESEKMYIYGKITGLRNSKNIIRECQ